MKDNMTTFKVFSLRPHWMQLVIDQLHMVTLLLVMWIAYAFLPHEYRQYACWGIILLNLYFIYPLVCIMRMEYIVTTEQIIYLHGFVRHFTDYMEMYRVIDYQQNRSLLQQMAGLKTVTIYSGDRNTPVMTLIGVRNNVDLIGEIRRRVEYNKERRHIYEITNRY